MRGIRGFLMGVLLLAGMSGCLQSEKKMQTSTKSQESASTDPSIDFLTGKSAQEFAGATFLIKVALTNIPESVSWHLYYTANAAGTDRTEIGGYSVATTEVTWETAGLSAGEYYLFASVTVGDQQLEFTAPGSVLVDHSLEKVSLTYYKDTKPIIDTACVSCHSALGSGSNSVADFCLDSYDSVHGISGIGGVLDRFKTSLQTNAMPPDPSKLSIDDKKMLLAWLDQGGAKGTPEAGQIPVPAIAISFVHPAATGENANASFVIEPQITNARSAATWQAYYSTVLGATANGTAIGSASPLSQTSITWDTSGLAANTYYIYVRVTDGSTTMTGAADGGISVSHPAAGNHAPTVTVTSPNGQAAYVRGTNLNITYTSTDADNDTLNYAISYSADAGVTWTSIIASNAGLSYSWSIPVNLTQGTKYRIKVTADDGKGGITSDTSDANFGIAAQTITYANTIANFMSNYCNACHSGTTSNQNFQSDAYMNGTNAAYDKRNLALSRMTNSTSPMPQSGLLSTGTLEPYQLWLWFGAPQGLTVSFTHPGTSNESANASFSIQPIIANALAGATWQAYYSTVSGATSGGTAIGTAVPVSQTSVTWDTSGLTAATYYIYIKVTEGSTITLKAATGGVSVSHPAPANNPPTVTVTSPNGNAAYVRGTNLTINYTANDPDGDTLTFKIEYSADGGSTWTQIVAANSGLSYNWAMPGTLTQGIKYRIRVTANDGKGGVASDISDANFGIATQTLTYTNTVVSFMTSYCNSCHSGATGNHNYQSDTYQNGAIEGTYDKRDLAWSRMNNAGMPMPQGGLLPAATLEPIQLWMWFGAPQ